MGMPASLLAPRPPPVSLQAPDQTALLTYFEKVGGGREGVCVCVCVCVEATRSSLPPRLSKPPLGLLS